MDTVRAACQSVARVWPGALICVTVALAATFLSEHYGGPQLLYALLMGLSLHFLYANTQITKGVDFCGRTVLRVGVALLGARITFGQVTQLGWETAAFIVAAVVSTILCGILLARLLGRRHEEGVLSGGAVAICGASAAMAISAVLPQSRDNERITLLNVVGVTVFSTVAMVAYPFLLRALELSPTQGGIFLGGTIHDVAQVVAAGMIVGPEAADTATIVKLFRVLLLMPIVLAIAVVIRARTPAAGVSRVKTPLVPAFLVAFVVLVSAASVGALPRPAISAAVDASRWLLVVAIAAAGVKTSFEDLLQLGWRSVVMLLIESVFIAAFVLVAILVGSLGVE